MFLGVFIGTRYLEIFRYSVCHCQKCDEALVLPGWGSLACMRECMCTCCVNFLCVSLLTSDTASTRTTSALTKTKPTQPYNATLQVTTATSVQGLSHPVTQQQPLLGVLQLPPTPATEWAPNEALAQVGAAHTRACEALGLTPQASPAAQPPATATQQHSAPAAAAGVEAAGFEASGFDASGFDASTTGFGASGFDASTTGIEASAASAGFEASGFAASTIGFGASGLDASTAGFEIERAPQPAVVDTAAGLCALVLARVTAHGARGIAPLPLLNSILVADKLDNRLTADNLDDGGGTGRLGRSSAGEVLSATGAEQLARSAAGEVQSAIGAEQPAKGSGAQGLAAAFAAVAESCATPVATPFALPTCASASATADENATAHEGTSAQENAFVQAGEVVHAVGSTMRVLLLDPWDTAPLAALTHAAQVRAAATAQTLGSAAAGAGVIAGSGGIADGIAGSQGVIAGSLGVIAGSGVIDAAAGHADAAGSGEEQGLVVGACAQVLALSPRLQVLALAGLQVRSRSVSTCWIVLPLRCLFGGPVSIQ